VNVFAQEGTTMRAAVARLGWGGVLTVVCALGCSRGTVPSARAPADEEGEARARFADLQAALKAGDADKVWALLSSKSQADADRAAQDFQAAYGKAGAEEKKTQEEAVGLSGDDLAALTGKGLLKTKRFRKKYDELPDSKVGRVTVEGDNATVFYREPDGDDEKLILVRQEGQWKAWLAVPRPAPP
jgi:hypothetical protein